MKVPVKMLERILEVITEENRTEKTPGEILKGTPGGTCEGISEALLRRIP